MPLKALHWTKLADDAIEASYFAPLAKESDISLDTTILEEMFCAKVTAKKEEDNGGAGAGAGGRAGIAAALNAALGGGGGAGAAAGKKESTAIQLIDSKRSYAVDICLSRFKHLSHEMIRNAIDKLDESILSTEKVQQLMTIMPTVEEVETIKSWVQANTTTETESNEISQLGTVEQFFHTLSSIQGFPDLLTRLDLWTFKSSFDEYIETIEVDIAKIEKALTSIVQSTRLRTVFHVILSLGNYLNGTNTKGGAYGFKLATLAQLKSLRSNDNQYTLLEYLTIFLNTTTHKDATKLNDAKLFIQDLSAVHAAASIESQYLSQEVGKLKGNMTKLQNAVKKAKDNASSSDRFAMVMGEFLEKALARFEALEQRFEAAAKQTDQVCVLFGEKADNGKWEQLFQRFDDFIQSYEAAEKKLERVKLQEEKKAQQLALQKQLQDRKAQKAAAAATNATPASPAETTPRLGPQAPTMAGVSVAALASVKLQQKRPSQTVGMGKLVNYLRSGKRSSILPTNIGGGAPPVNNHNLMNARAGLKSSQPSSNLSSNVIEENNSNNNEDEEEDDTPQACGDCDCKQFVKHPTKRRICSNCMHSH